ncbi:MAG: TolC family protein [Gemmatimonadaceae bacterium]
MQPVGSGRHRRPLNLVSRFIGACGGIAAAFCLLVLAPATVASAQQTSMSRDSAGAPPAQPVSLDDAVRMAAAKSEVVRIANNAILRARGSQYQARSGLFPQLNASANYTRTLASQFASAFSSPGPSLPPGPLGPCNQYLFNGDSSQLARVAGLENYARCTVAGHSASETPGGGGIDFSKVGFGSKNGYTLALSGSQNIFTGGRLSGMMQSANATQRSARIELSAQQAQLRLDVTSAYYDAALSDRLLTIAESSLKQTQDLLKQTQLQAQVGNTSEFDLLRAQVSVSNQLPVVIQAQSAREVAYLRLKQLLKLPYEERIALTTSVEDSTAAPPGVDLARAQSPDTVTDHRAPVREANEAVLAQKGQLKVAHAERIPTLAVSTAYSRLAYPSSGLPSLADFRPNWTVTLSTSFPIFLGGRIRGDQMIAESNVRDAQARLQQAREGAALDSRVALNTLTQAKATLAASAGTAAQAQRAYQIAEVRFKEGISTQLELNDTRNQLAQALVNRAQASRDVQVARVRLALLPDLPMQTAPAGQTNLSQQQQAQQQQPQQQTPSPTGQPGGTPGQGTPPTGGVPPTGSSGNNQ